MNQSKNPGSTNSAQSNSDEFNVEDVLREASDVVGAGRVRLTLPLPHAVSEYLYLMRKTNRTYIEQLERVRQQEDLMEKLGGLLAGLSAAYAAMVALGAPSEGMVGFATAVNRAGEMYVQVYEQMPAHYAKVNLFKPYTWRGRVNHLVSLVVLPEFDGRGDADRSKPRRWFNIQALKEYNEQAETFGKMMAAFDGILTALAWAVTAPVPVVSQLVIPAFVKDGIIPEGAARRATEVIAEGTTDVLEALTAGPEGWGRVAKAVPAMTKRHIDALNQIADTKPGDLLFKVIMDGDIIDYIEQSMAFKAWTDES